MVKKWIVCFIVLSYHVSNAQNSISGKIVDQDNVPLSGATIFIPDMNKGTVSDSQGMYKISDLPDGKIKIQFACTGYSDVIETAELHGVSQELNVILRQTAIEMEAIVVSGGYSTTQHNNAVKIDILKLDKQTIINSPNFAEILTKVPGVDMISKGSGVSKPVIRGLSMNDILVLNNGVRFENYQYSSHHPLGIDEFGLEDVEIIKGPASLLYGSDAIGGVINFIKEKPAPVGTFAGDYNLQLFSNTLGMTNNVGLKGASDKFSGGIRIGQKTNSDFLQGGGAFVPNSRFNDLSVKANAGYTNKAGAFRLFYEFNLQKPGLVEEEAVEEIKVRDRKNEIYYQVLNTHLVSTQNKLYFGKFKLDINAAFQNTGLIHYGEAGIYEIQMELATWTYDAKLHLPSKENCEYIIGLQGFNQKNTNLNDRETKLLPNALTNNYAAFGLMQFAFFEKLKLQTGLRYDMKEISTQAIGTPAVAVTYRPPLEKSYGSFSGSLGATYNMSEKLLFRANFAAAYRTPNLAELTSNGQHELRFEIGDKNLVPEKSYETDFSIHYHKDNFTFDVAGFYNKVRNYIFISPTGDVTTTGIDIYRYKQANSVLSGGEAGLHFHPEPIKWLHLETTFSSVIGKQQNGDYLPFVPAHKWRFEWRAEKEKLQFLRKVFFFVNTCTAFDQNHAAPDETSTAGYTLIDTGAGGMVKVKNQTFSFSIGINNVLDTKYTDHLSILREVNFFNPGRNISLHLRIPFGTEKVD